MRTIAFRLASESEKKLGLPDNYIIEWTYTDLQTQEILDTYQNFLPEEDFNIILQQNNSQNNLDNYNILRAEENEIIYLKHLQAQVQLEEEFEAFKAWKASQNQ